MQVLEKIKAELAAFEAKKRVFVEQLRSEFPQIVSPIFEISENLEKIGWAQYTPYFNDGDECVFGVRRDRDSLYVNGQYGDDSTLIQEYVYETITSENIEEHRKQNANDPYHLNNQIGAWGRFINKDRDVSLCESVSKFSEILMSIPDEFLKDLFGDHTKITIHRDGSIETEEYDHD